MHSILEITTFFTPADTRDDYEEKEKKVITVLDDIIRNSGEDFHFSENKDDVFYTSIYALSGIELRINIKKDDCMDDVYIPHMLLEVYCESSMFEKTNVEDFLNTIARAFSGPFSDVFFISHDEQYTLDDINSGKKYSIDDLEDIDMRNSPVKENKKTFDALLFLHYSLMKNIWNISLVRSEIDANHISSKNFLAYLNQGNLRLSITESGLIKSLNVLHSQIEKLLSHHIT